jgi:hypothetical protein
MIKYRQTTTRSTTQCETRKLKLTEASVNGAIGMMLAVVGMLIIVPSVSIVNLVSIRRIVMRKVTRETVTAFVNGTTKSTSNTVSTGTELILHGNVIARKDGNGGITATLASWPTPTTKERLNGLCELLGLGRMFYQKRGEQFFGDAPIESDEWVTLVAAPQPEESLQPA